MSQHGLRLLIWLSMTTAICVLTWIAFRGSIKRANQQLANAKKELHSAEVTGDRASTEDAKHRVAIWLKESRSIYKQRNVCILVMPGIVAIILLIYL